MPPQNPTASIDFARECTELLAEATRGATTETVLNSILDCATRATGSSRGFLALVDHTTGELNIIATRGEGWTDQNSRHRLDLANASQRGITGHVVVTAQSYISNDVTQDPHYVCYFDDVRSECAAPIIGPQNQPWGVLNVEDEASSAYADIDRTRMEVLANVAGAALWMDGFRVRESALIEIGKRLNATLDIDKLMQTVVRVAGDALHFEDCSVFLVDDQTDHLVLQASKGALSKQAGMATYHMGEGLTGWVALHAEPIRAYPPQSDPRWVGLHTELATHQLGAFLAVPIISRDRVLGVMRILRRRSHAPWFSNHFTDADERILQTIAGQLGTALENARSFNRLVKSERMAAWGELSAKSAHMIGNRTFAMEGDVNELLHLVAELPESDHKRELELLAQSMQRGIERLEEILAEFRDFVMATQLAIFDTDIVALLKEVLDETFPKRSPVELVLELSEGLPILKVDSRKLKRAFGELVENAVSFMPEGGTLFVRAHRVTDTERAECRIAHERDYICVEVEDTGPGVPKEAKSRIFRPFYSSRVKGMGLGLSIVKGIVEAHSGILHEVGEPGSGAKFLIFFPVP